MARQFSNPNSDRHRHAGGRSTQNQHQKASEIDWNPIVTRWAAYLRSRDRQQRRQRPLSGEKGPVGSN